MVIPRVCFGKQKSGDQVPYKCTSSAHAKLVKVPATTSSLTFDTEANLPRYTVMKNVIFLNMLFTLVAVVVSAGACLRIDLGSSEHEIESLRGQVRLLMDQHDDLLVQFRSLKNNLERNSLDANGVSESRYSNVNPGSEHLITGTQRQDTVAKNVVAIGEKRAAEVTEERGVRGGDPPKKKQLPANEIGVEHTLASSYSEESEEENSVGDASSQYGILTPRRTKRSDWRGKQSQRKSSNAGRARQRRKEKFSGAAVAHFKGAQPETCIRDGGSLVAPWFLDSSGSGQFSLSSVQLKQGKGAVEVAESGLYYIYSQIYYLTSQVINSYSLNLRHGSQTNSSVLSYCSASSQSAHLNEISCFTSVVRYLNATDRVFIHQRDMNRRIILRDGYSYLGLVRLNT